MELIFYVNLYLTDCLGMEFTAS